MQYKNPFRSWSPTAPNSSSMRQMWKGPKGYSKALMRTWCLNWRNGAQSLLHMRGVHKVSRIWRRFILGLLNPPGNPWPTGPGWVT